MSVLDQTCPRCGMTEAAGAYCTACSTPTRAPHWHPVKRSVAQSAAAARLAANRGKETANPAIVAGREGAA